MPKYNSQTQGADNRARISDQHRAQHATAVNSRKAASLLKPLVRSASLGMRAKDIEIFSAAALLSEHIVMLRYTNPKSFDYFLCKNYVPKPFDCKPKTADSDIYIPGYASLVKCGGLVIDPTVLGYSAFSAEKMIAARDEWDQFLSDKPRSQRERKIYPRKQANKGFFAVDTDRSGKHFGCLMLSEQEVPGPKFNLHDGDHADFKRHHMSYIHGDYDLYGLIDVAGTLKTKRDSGGREKFSPVRREEMLLGARHVFDPQYAKVRDFINREIGGPLVQHAGQDNLTHKGDTVYVFYPDGNNYTIAASADAIREIYELVFQQEARP
jgi:hypothetical protein